MPVAGGRSRLGPEVGTITTDFERVYGYLAQLHRGLHEGIVTKHDLFRGGILHEIVREILRSLSPTFVTTINLDGRLHEEGSSLSWNLCIPLEPRD